MTELLKKAPELSTKETTEKDPMITKYPKLSKEFFLLVNAWDTLRSPDTIKSLNFKWQYLSSHDMKYLNDCKNIEEIKLDNIKTLEWMDFTKYEKIKSISVQFLDIKEFRQIKDTITWLEQLAKLAKKNYRKVQEYEGQKLTMVDTTSNIDEYIKKWDAKYKAKDFVWAIADYSKVIELDPNNMHAYSKRAASKDSIGDHEWAQQDYREVDEIVNAIRSKN